MEAYALSDLHLRDAEKGAVFRQAQQATIVIIRKDSDFVEMVLQFGTPPQLLWVTCGNVTNSRLHNLFTQVFPQAQALLASGETVVEIAGFEDT